MAYQNLMTAPFTSDSSASDSSNDSDYFPASSSSSPSRSPSPGSQDGQQDNDIPLFPVTITGVMSLVREHVGLTEFGVYQNGVPGNANSTGLPVSAILEIFEQAEVGLALEYHRGYWAGFQAAVQPLPIPVIAAEPLEVVIIEEIIVLD